MIFPLNTYVVLEVPSPWAERVLEVRRLQRDFFRYSLPAETTLCGSNGVGPIRSEEDPDHVFEIIDRIASEVAPISTQFGRASRFPGSDVFYLSFSDDELLRGLHDRLAKSGIRFSPVPFPFTPHVTLSTRSHVSEPEAAELLATTIAGQFTLDTLAVYELPLRQPPTDRFETLLCEHFRTRLRGPRP